MLDQILSQFTGSTEAGALAQSLIGKGLSATQAKDAVAATVEGTKEAVGSDGISGLMGLLGGGGGGAAGMMGAITGMLGGAGPSATAGVAGPMVDKISAFVASKAGIDPKMAKTVVDLVLPKIIELAKGEGGGLGGAVKNLFQ